MLTVVVQAGGESRRMGRDKALMPFLERTLIERVVERLTPLADELLVTTNHPDGYRFLDLPLIPDLIAERGALSGLYTALHAASHPLVAVVACDMPFVSASLLEVGRDILIQDEADAVIPQTGEGTEPFHAVYRKTTCLLAVKCVLEKGARRADAWFELVLVRYLSPEEIRFYDPENQAFWNINTLEELYKAERIALLEDSI